MPRRRSKESVDQPVILVAKHQLLLELDACCLLNRRDEQQREAYCQNASSCIQKVPLVKARLAEAF